ncbi:hypothetical protein LX81_02890 [Palleronia aestuarii]|uniref:Uncharacterized protein n=1 Tax=Palleronia aestuarii TaxID=568105 RepID=A0A2W7N7Y6_9RHOB|nr:hypothetical protein [Palleronia aestuarii]PZX14307.1 hypothetical protein LX81_02890 [Palleronia aestuarii]
MAYDPTDPGPVLASHDPNWKARFEAAASQLRALGEGTILDREQAALRTRLVEEKGAAYLAKHQNAWERDAFLRDQHVPPFIGPEPGQIDIPVPSPPHDASPEEMLAHYQRFHRLAYDLEHYLELEPAMDWEGGLFAETLVDGRTREVFDAEIPLEWGSVPIRARFAVEAWDDVVHVCALQRPHGDEVVAGVRSDDLLVAG